MARVDRHRLIHLAAAQPIQMGPYAKNRTGTAIEGELTVQVQFVDDIEPRLQGRNVHEFLLMAINAVDATIAGLREAEASS